MTDLLTTPPLTIADLREAMRSYLWVMWHGVEFKVTHLEITDHLFTFVDIEGIRRDGRAIEGRMTISDDGTVDDVRWWEGVDVDAETKRYIDGSSIPEMDSIWQNQLAFPPGPPIPEPEFDGFLPMMRDKHGRLGFDARSKDVTTVPLPDVKLTDDDYASLREQPLCVDQIDRDYAAIDRIVHWLRNYQHPPMIVAARSYIQRVELEIKQWARENPAIPAVLVVIYVVLAIFILKTNP
jgi:hypothetical protein